jgi:hypothetical protein
MTYVGKVGELVLLRTSCFLMTPHTPEAPRAPILRIISLGLYLAVKRLITTRHHRSK